jgi:FAD/FMN-containing dehydrogenase
LKRDPSDHRASTVTRESSHVMSILNPWSRRRFLQAASAAPIVSRAGVLAAAGTGKVPSLDQSIAGTVVTRQDADYDTWRKAMIWQRAKADRRPDMIVQVERIEDVQQAVRYAAERGIKVTTRCGGHSTSACFLRNTGMLIDVSRLDGIQVNKLARTAIVGPGVFAASLSNRLARDGLAFPGAHNGSVPISGFLLGGGLGLNAKGYTSGVSAFAVHAVDIVVADGRLLHASETQNSDLLWAVRGGGPGLFGVVVKFYLRCFDAPAMMWGATCTFPYTELEAVASMMAEVAPELDKDVEVAVAIMEAEGTRANAPVEERQRVYIALNAFVSGAAEGKNKLAPVLTQPLMSRAIEPIDSQAMSLDRYYSEAEAGDAQGFWMSDNIWADDPLAMVRVAKKHIPHCPTPRSLIAMSPMGHPVLPEAAFSRIGRFYVTSVLWWDDAAHEQPIRDYSAQLIKDLKPLSRGSYINEMNQQGRPQDIHECYSPEAWARLAALRKHWDPRGVFHGFYGES